MAVYTRAQAYALYKDDYTMHDGYEDVTYVPTSGDSVAEVKAKQEIPGQSLADMGHDIADDLDECKWVLWDTTLDGTVPTEGGKITTAGGDTWTIVSLTKELWDTQWHCQCKKDR